MKKFGLILLTFLLVLCNSSNDSTDVVDTSTNLTNRDGNYFTSAITQSISKDKRNSRLFPSSGYVYGLNQTFAHLASDVPYLRNRIFSNSYALSLIHI